MVCREVVKLLDASFTVLERWAFLTIIDWFHITMRLTVLHQQTKALQAERPDEGAAASKQIESIKHLLWHGNVDEVLDRIDSLFMDLDLISRCSAAAQKLAAGISELRTYIRNNRGSIPNYGERYRQGERISTAFVESTINQVVSRRFVKKQQMQWTLEHGKFVLNGRNPGRWNFESFASSRRRDGSGT